MQLTFAFPIDADYRAEDFIVSDANREAYAWIDAWPRWNTHALMLSGPSGSGKTHLAQLWAMRAQALILPPQAVGQHASMELLPTGRHAVIEGLEQVVDEPALTQLLNHACENNHTLLLTSVLPPEQLPFRLPDLTSRLSALPKALLHEPDDALLAAVLSKQFSDRQLSVSADAKAWLFTRTERRFAALSALVQAIDTASLQDGRAITLPWLRRFLSEHPEYR